MGKNKSDDAGKTHELSENLAAQCPIHSTTADYLENDWRYMLCVTQTVKVILMYLDENILKSIRDSIALDRPACSWNTILYPTAIISRGEQNCHG